MKGDSFTVQMGHLIDRTVLAAVQYDARRRYKEADGEESTDGTAADGGDGGGPLDLSFLLAILSMAPCTPMVGDRVEIFLDVMCQSGITDENDEPDVDGVRRHAVVANR